MIKNSCEQVLLMLLKILHNSLHFYLVISITGSSAIGTPASFKTQRRRFCLQKKITVSSFTMDFSSGQFASFPMHN